ncbi:hypothetical protein P8452_05591 [Trifolium repens]|jgi:hypothetical protein|nr:hypothetical protein QL285_006174 [Trifolium repens]WJX15450.1 hypothetical protein P8452_05591 [Trifolium repens]
MINQLGWDNLNLSCLPTHRNLTLEFLSSLRYAPDYGFSIHKRLARFRLFGVPYRYSHRDIAEFMNVPNSSDDVTKVQEDDFIDYELQNFWGSISGDPNSDPGIDSTLRSTTLPFVTSTYPRSYHLWEASK